VTEPYRQRPNQCPVCGVDLRLFGTRLCCDRCEGIFLTIADLAHSIDELTRVEPAIAFAREQPGHRPCPGCSAAMATCHLELAMMDKVVKPDVELDRCAAHGLWFDTDELAELLLAVERVFGSHGGSSGPAGSSNDDGPLGSYGKFNAPP
jgi:Zn-finger nucleic acid-binding protein